MSILIKGMEMPTNCRHCPCADDGSRYCKAANEYIPMLGKPKFCPLIEVPPHGRLIDADALMELFDWWEHEYDETDSYLINMRQDVLTLPTVDKGIDVPITDEIAQKIIEEANKACANCQEWVCDECEYRHWRNRG